jgi:hypothetical protein
MSSIWTPGGERPIRRDPRADDPSDRSAQPLAADFGDADEPTPEEMHAQLEALQEQLARTPASAVIANHCFGLFELAALHLSLQPPQLSEAQLAIDALALLIDGLAGRLGEQEIQLREGLASLRLAFVQIRAASPGQADPPAE